MTKLTDKKIRWIIRQKDKRERSNNQIAMAMKISPRRVQQINQVYKETGEIPKLSKCRRPKRELTDKERRIIDKAYNEVFLGARLLRHHIKRYYRADIPHNKIHEHLLSKGKAEENKRKKRKRKRCRYERKHSLSLLHMDWAEYNGWNIIGCEDDASRKILSIGEFDEATGDHSINVLKKAEKEVDSINAFIIAINTDKGSQFYANKKGKKGKGKSNFQKYLESRGIKHIPSRRNNPQTNGKIERWVQEYKKHRHRFKTAEEFMEWYNNRLHGALGVENAETPNEAFIRKLRPDVLLGMFFRFMDG